ncbi:3-hydroxyacyl-[acyl-carrier-protein] dehydratase [Algoriphagus sp. 4150]|uniref:hypothetical protein n=1 Tax=Algoriphagus sp. 4150 TaxID=2817756 RepID=UPI00285C7FC6|nr:hypothetical protein [Algoriphagus sp. 4150]MDR7129132.1 3-hydroxyacyl-[acyl-carrier-protein] dehydratase [Algoriphagus sp. 4150]
MQQLALNQTIDISILSQAETDSVIEVRVLGNSPVFEGHFPGNPILPGVIMVEAVRSSLQKLFGKEFHLKTALSIKFLSVLNPAENEIVHLGIKHTEVENGLKIEANLFLEDTVFFKMKGVYSQV